MFDVNPKCIITIDKETFIDIFGDINPKFFTGSNPDIYFLRNNQLLNEVASEEGIDFETEVITPLEDIIFCTVEFKVG